MEGSEVKETEQSVVKHNVSFFPVPTLFEESHEGTKHKNGQVLMSSVVHDVVLHV